MSDQRALRRGSLTYYRDPDGADHLYDLASDTLEQADLTTLQSAHLGALKTAWERVDAGLLPYN